MAKLYPARAQLRTVNGISGVNFAVWAPNATSVSLIGDFNNWEGRRHPMRKHIPSGFWELFVPGLKEGAIYKFRVKTGASEVDKCDPYGFAAEIAAANRPKVADLDRYQWGDDAWVANRREAQRARCARCRCTKSIWAVGGGRATIRIAG